MTKERTKELLPFIIAYAEGETIQYQPEERHLWTDAKNALFTGTGLYRIKPKLPMPVQRNLYSTDLANMQVKCKHYIENLDHGVYDEDFPQKLYEDFMIALYGSDIFDWINAKSDIVL